MLENKKRVTQTLTITKIILIQLLICVIFEPKSHLQGSVGQKIYHTKLVLLTHISDQTDGQFGSLQFSETDVFSLFRLHF